MTIAVFGSIGMDVTAYMDQLPKPGETLHGNSYLVGLGGKGANQAVASHRLGCDTHFIGRIGRDDFGASARQALESFGLSVANLLIDPHGATALAIIYVSARGENIISVIGGTNLNMDESDVVRSTSQLQKAKVLLLQREVPMKASLEAARVTKSAGGIVVLDPAPAPKSPFTADVFRAVDVMTPNETETASLLGWQPTTLDEGLKAAQALHDLGCANAVVKLGAKGLAFVSAKHTGILPAFKVTAIDTVAAGDCFNGGLAYGLSEGMVLPEALRIAAACGALSTTKHGAANSAATKAELEAFLKTAKTV